MNGISIIICCYNSEKRLPLTLHHIAQLNITDRLQYEVIVVNNNSSDNSRLVALEEWNKYDTKFNLRVIDEPTPGLSNARKRGVLAAKFDLIIFCDDDNILAPDYANVAYKIFLENDTIGACSGESIELLNSEIPYWFEEFKSAFAIGKQSDSNGIVKDPKKMLWGAGLCVRKDALLKIFSTPFWGVLNDRTGKELTSGGDGAISLGLKFLNYQLAYSNSLKLKHVIPKERLTIDYLKALFKGFGLTSPFITIFNCYIVSKRFFTVLSFNRIYFVGLFYNLFKYLIISFNINVTKKKNILRLNCNKIFITNRIRCSFIEYKQIFKLLIKLRKFN